MAGRPFAWEKSYPPGLKWDAPVTPFVLTDILDEQEQVRGDSPAIEFRGQEISYTKLSQLAGQLGAGLLHLGVRKQDRVALYVPNAPCHPVAVFGVFRAGGIAVQLSPLDAPAELAFKLDDCGARILITTDLESLLPQALALLDHGKVDRLIVISDADFGPGEAPRMAIPVRPDVVLFGAFSHLRKPAAWPALRPSDIALLQYTGGTTGHPKGVILTHANISSAVGILEIAYGAQIDVKPGEGRALLVLPLFHIFAFSAVLMLNLRLGNRISLRMRFVPEAIMADIERERITHFPGVPTMWIGLMALPEIEKRDFSSLRFCMSGGAPLPVEVQARVEGIVGQRLNNGWGMTETAPTGIHTPMSGPIPSGAIGLPQPRVEIAIVSVDDAAREVPVGEAGEIKVRGPNVSPGYWNRPQETAEAFVDGWLMTGDVAIMDENGFFTIVDRKKDLIISGGFNVYPQIIEQALYEHPDIEEAAVIGIPDDYRGEAAKAYVKLKAGAPPLTLESLTAFLVPRLGKHEMPRALEIRAALPRTSVGKLSRKALRDEMLAARKRG